MNQNYAEQIDESIRKGDIEVCDKCGLIHELSDYDNPDGLHNVPKFYCRKHHNGYYGECHKCLIERLNLDNQRLLQKLSEIINTFDIQLGEVLKKMDQTASYLLGDKIPPKTLSNARNEVS